MAGFFEEFEKQTLVQKAYLDAFDQVVSPSRERSPALRQTIKESIERGSFVLDFLGHGNEFEWMDERVINEDFVDSLTNRFQLPIIVTATCQFGRYDDPEFFSGSERLLLNPNGGGIALLTTTRPVFASSNELVNRAFHETLFERNENGFLRLGDVMRNTKNNSLSRLENRNFALLGDPMLTLAYPDYIATISEINGKSLSGTSDTLSALEEITLTGQILHQDSSLNSDFNGEVQITLLDATDEVRTLGQESLPFSYEIQENALFRGLSEVVDGEFTSTFTITRNTSYRFANGKISLYASNAETNEDANGAIDNILLGGTAPVPLDDNPPVIELFVNDPGFRNGQTVESSSLLIARVTDDNGINISSNGINQNITLVLNDETPLVLNEFYVAATNDFQTGFVTFPLNSLEEGRYEAEIKLWDTHNNSSSARVEFVVTESTRINLTNVMNFPNPANQTTTFSFEHDRLGEELEISIDLFNSQGALAESLRYEVDNSSQRIDDLAFDLGASSISVGIYVYQITVRSTLDGAIGREVRRLIVN